MGVMKILDLILGGGMSKDVAKRARKTWSQVSDRMDEVDTAAMRKQLNSLSEQIAALTAMAFETVESRVRPRPRRRFPVMGLMAFGLMAGIGYLLFESNRRGALRSSLERIDPRAPQILDRASQTVTNLRQRSSNGALSEAALAAAVEGSIATGGDVPGLRVEVEGRTVYLRGNADDRAALDRAIERAQSVPGVAAVVNLASVPATTV